MNVTRPRLCPMTDEEWRQRIRDAQEAARARQRAAAEQRAEAARQELAKQREIAEYLAAHPEGAASTEPEPPVPPSAPADELPALPAANDVPGNVAFLNRLGKRSAQAAAPEWPGAET